MKLCVFFIDDLECVDEEKKILSKKIPMIEYISFVFPNRMFNIRQSFVECMAINQQKGLAKQFLFVDIQRDEHDPDDNPLALDQME